MKIFVSYSHKDSNMVLPIVEELLKIYGSKNVIIDRYSNVPGDSLIGFMNNSLEAFTHFLFFLSTNSIESYLTSLEWKNALLLCKNPDKRFIPIVVDSVSIPPIIGDKIYVNLYAHGISHAFQEIRASVENRPVYNETPIENLRAKVALREHEIVLTVESVLYSEPNPSFCIAFKEKEKVDFRFSENFQGSTDIIEIDGKDRFVFFVRLFRSLAAGTSFSMSFSRNNNNDIYLVMHVQEIEGNLKGKPIRLECI